MNDRTTITTSSAPSYTLREAAAKCGYRRANTMREKHLATPTQREALGHRIRNGLALLDAQAVDALAAELEREREERGNWRIANLGRYARKWRRSSAGVSRGGNSGRRNSERAGSEG
jgi:hypothetical protein